MPALAALRRRRLLSQRELAKRAGVAPSSVYLIERRRTAPQLAVMRKILDALGLDNPADVDEFRHVAPGFRDQTEADVIPNAATDPVLAELWDNDEDAIYDQLAASIGSGDARA